MADAMTRPVTERPAICLNMIVRNEAHIVTEVLDAVAPYISSWVIVDTGSGDGTQDLIRSHLARLGIPGELHERPWRNFGHNRTEALALAQGHGAYIWVMDADDTVVGTPDFARLTADIYLLRVEMAPDIYWRAQLFRDGVAVHYVGVVHEYANWDNSYSQGRIEGNYYIKARQLGARQLSGRKFAGDRDLLLAEIARNPDDARSAFYLAQTYYWLDDFANAQRWYNRRAEMGGFEEEVYYALWRIAECMARLGAPWPGVQNVYLQAWEFRPTRAEPLYFIAFRYRLDQRYRLGYQFAKMAAEIPFPAEDLLFVGADIYAWCAADEQAICASWIGKHAEAFALWRGLLARADVPVRDRERMAENRDMCVPAMLDAASSYPDALVQALQGQLASPPDTDVVVSLVAGPDRPATERTLNSFLHCCTDLAKIGRFLVLDTGLSAADRAMLLQRYGFLEFIKAGPGAELARIRAQIHGRFWLHLGQGWTFFAPEDLITRLTAVLHAEPEVAQVAVNVTDAAALTGSCAPEASVRRGPDTGRYVLTDAPAHGPAMFDTTRLDPAGGLGTASLDEVLCLAAV